jgi:ubiquinone/menaquinone biosynthesis C-methylase UbiE
MEADRKRIVTPAGIELTLEAEKHVEILKDHRMLSVGCGTGELESYLAGKYGCFLTSIDINLQLIEAANKKSTERLKFQTGNGEALDFGNEVFDIIYSCGSIGEFFDKGILEFDRCLKTGGKVILIEVIYMGDFIPKEIKQIWKKRKVKVLTKEGMLWEFEKIGLKSVFSRSYYEPGWWEVYYADHNDSDEWTAERDNYRRYREHIAIGLFIFEKTGRKPLAGYSI